MDSKQFNASLEIDEKEFNELGIHSENKNNSGKKDNKLNTNSNKNKDYFDNYIIEDD